MEDHSTDQLRNMMWDAVIPAWIGSSIGFLAIVLGSVWRWATFPPMLVIRYGDGGEVWSFQGRLWRDGEPSVPLWANLLYLSLLLFGGFYIWFFPRNWRKIGSELERRKSVGKPL